MQLRRMAEASLALAERRPDDLKAAVEKLGQQAPSSRQLFILRLMGLIAPPKGASLMLKARSVLLVVAIVVGLLAIGSAVAALVLLPFGGGGVFGTVITGLLIVVIALTVLGFVGKRRQAAAKAKARAARAG
jgi:hypothetical protein